MFITALEIDRYFVHGVCYKKVVTKYYAHYKGFIGIGDTVAKAISNCAIAHDTWVATL